MSFYCWYQLKHDSSWTLALDEERENIANTIKPELFTILSCDNSFTEDLTSEQIANVKYKARCLYFDFDATDIEEATTQATVFLNNLKAKGLNLDSVKVFASGSKGYHVEIAPESVFGKPPPTGIANYPAILKEFAHAVYVETLDLRVYSAKKGRSWRQPNVKRDNGSYKVQITAEELMSMTPVRYKELVSNPRPLFPVAPPTLAPDLNLIYSTARDKVDAVAKARKRKKKSAEQLKGFGGQWPDVVRGMLQGSGLKESVGFNLVALQLAIVASTLGKKEEELLADAQGLLETHSGDGTRYNSASKRKSALRDMFRYVNENPCYEYASGPVVALLKPEVAAHHDLGRGDYVPEPKVVGEDGKVVEPEADDFGPLKIDKQGIFAKQEEVWRKICDVGLADPMLLQETKNVLIGYEVDVYIEGIKTGREMLGLDKFMSKSSFQSWTMKWSVAMKGTDQQASMIADVLRRKTKKDGNVALVVKTEGVDLIVPPDATSEDDYEIIWSSPHGVISLNENIYRYKPTLEANGMYKSDLARSPELQNTEEDATLIDDLLEVNSTQNMAKLLGWFTAAFLCPLFRRFHRQFPSLQVYGQAGAGKSKSVALLNQLHYFLQSPRELMATGQTQFPIICAVSSSSSIPVVFEEVKPREMQKSQYDFLLNIFRSNYNAHSIARGNVDKSKGGGEVVVNEFNNRGPLCFVGEALETQAAILERCIIVSLVKQDRHGRDAHYHRVNARKTELGKLGKALMYGVMAIDVARFREEFADLLIDVTSKVGAEAEGADRPLFNLAVALMGLEFLRTTLGRTFGDRFDERIQAMKDSLSYNVAEQIPQNMSEASRVMDVLAQLTRSEDLRVKLTKDRDYSVDLDTNTVDVKMKPCFAKYVLYCRNLGQSPLFDSDVAFIAAMRRYEGVVAKACPDNPVLYTSAFEPIYRFSIAFLEKETVEPFEP